jgi:hypothetical protein
VGALLLIVSIVLSPDAWRQFADVMLARGPSDASTLLPIPYYARAVAALILVAVAARIKPAWGEPLLVLGVVIALPTLWFTALSTLIAVVPLVRRPATVQAS